MSDEIKWKLFAKEATQHMKTCPFDNLECHLRNVVARTIIRHKQKKEIAYSES